MNEEDVEIVKGILAKPADARAYDDIIVLKGKFGKLDKLQLALLSMAPQELDFFCRSMQMEHFERGELVFSEGDHGDKMYIVLEGMVEIRTKRGSVTSLNLENVHHTVFTCRPGTQFGERALEKEERRAGSAVCTAQTNLASVSRRAYKTLLNSVPTTVDADTGTSIRRNPDDHCRSILIKPRDLRTTDELIWLTQFLSRRVPFFRKFERDNLQQVCRALDLVTFLGAACVFRQGSPGLAFYIILSGSVEVRVRSAIDGAIQEVVVNTLEKGQYFGERALEGTTDRRQASVHTITEPTELLVLSRDDYLSMVASFREKEQDNKVKLLRSVIGLDRLPQDVLVELVKFLEPRSFRINDMLCEQGTRTQDMYIINKGECNVFRHQQLDDGTKYTIDLGRVGRGTLMGSSIVSASTFAQDHTWSESVVATTHCTVYVLAKMDYYNRLTDRARDLMRRHLTKLRKPVTQLWDVIPDRVPDNQVRQTARWGNVRRDIVTHTVDAERLRQACNPTLQGMAFGKFYYPPEAGLASEAKESSTVQTESEHVSNLVRVTNDPFALSEEQLQKLQAAKASEERELAAAAKLEETERCKAFLREEKRLAAEQTTLADGSMGLGRQAGPSMEKLKPERPTNYAQERAERKARERQARASATARQQQQRQQQETSSKATDDVSSLAYDAAARHRDTIVAEATAHAVAAAKSGAGSGDSEHQSRLRPFSVVQIHRERDPNATGTRRPARCYVRILGCFPSTEASKEAVVALLRDMRLRYQMRVRASQADMASRSAGGASGALRRESTSSEEQGEVDDANDQSNCDKMKIEGGEGGADGGLGAFERTTVAADEHGAQKDSEDGEEVQNETELTDATDDGSSLASSSVIPLAEEEDLCWHQFTSYEMVGVDKTDHIFVFCRDAPVDFVSFNLAEVLGHTFDVDENLPPTCRVKGQRYACAVLREVQPHPATATPSDLVKEPMFLKELRVVSEIHNAFSSKFDAARHARAMDRVFFRSSPTRLCVIPMYHWIHVSQDTLDKYDAQTGEGMEEADDLVGTSYYAEMRRVLKQAGMLASDGYIHIEPGGSTKADDRVDPRTLTSREAARHSLRRHNDKMATTTTAATTTTTTTPATATTHKADTTPGAGVAILTATTKAGAGASIASVLSNPAAAALPTRAAVTGSTRVVSGTGSARGGIGGRTASFHVREKLGLMLVNEEVTEERFREFIDAEMETKNLHEDVVRHIRSGAASGVVGRGGGPQLQHHHNHLPPPHAPKTKANAVVLAHLEESSFTATSVGEDSLGEGDSSLATSAEAGAAASAAASSPSVVHDRMGAGTGTAVSTATATAADGGDVASGAMPRGATHTGAPEGQPAEPGATSTAGSTTVDGLTPPQPFGIAAQDLGGALSVQASSVMSSAPLGGDGHGAGDAGPVVDSEPSGVDELDQERENSMSRTVEQQQVFSLLSHRRAQLLRLNDELCRHEDRLRANKQEVKKQAYPLTDAHTRELVVLQQGQELQRFAHLRQPDHFGEKVLCGMIDSTGHVDRDAYMTGANGIAGPRLELTGKHDLSWSSALAPSLQGALSDVAKVTAMQGVDPQTSEMIQAQKDVNKIEMRVSERRVGLLMALNTLPSKKQVHQRLHRVKKAAAAGGNAVGGGSGAGTLHSSASAGNLAVSTAGAKASGNQDVLGALFGPSMAGGGTATFPAAVLSTTGSSVVDPGPSRSLAGGGSSSAAGATSSIISDPHFDSLAPAAKGRGAHRQSHAAVNRLARKLDALEDLLAGS